MNITSIGTGYNLVKSSQSFGLKFTDNAKRLIQNSKGKYNNDGTKYVLLNDLYTQMQNDKFSNCKLDVDKNGIIKYTLSVSQNIGQTVKNEKQQNYISLEALYDISNYIYGQLHKLQTMGFKF